MQLKQWIVNSITSLQLFTAVLKHTELNANMFSVYNKMLTSYVWHVSLVTLS